MATDPSAVELPIVRRANGHTLVVVSRTNGSVGFDFSRVEAVLDANVAMAVRWNTANYAASLEGEREQEVYDLPGSNAAYLPLVRAGDRELHREALWTLPARRKVELPTFAIDRTRVTCGQYAAFLSATGGPPPSGWGGRHMPEGDSTWPVCGVTYEDAARYAAWVGLALPSDVEWEIAGGGGDGRRFPWGDVQALALDAIREGASQYRSADAFPELASPFGVLGMMGSSWEWCEDLYWTRAIPAPHSGRHLLSGVSPTWRALRGGTRDDMPYALFSRFGCDPNASYWRHGFRCVLRDLGSARTEQLVVPARPEVVPVLPPVRRERVRETPIVRPEVVHALRLGAAVERAGERVLLPWGATHEAIAEALPLERVGYPENRTRGWNGVTTLGGLHVPHLICADDPRLRAVYATLAECYAGGDAALHAVLDAYDDALEALEQRLGPATLEDLGGDERRASWTLGSARVILNVREGSEFSGFDLACILSITGEADPSVPPLPEPAPIPPVPAIPPVAAAPAPSLVLDLGPELVRSWKDGLRDLRLARSPLQRVTRAHGGPDDPPCVERHFGSQSWHVGSGVPAAEHPRVLAGGFNAEEILRARCGDCGSADVLVVAFQAGASMGGDFYYDLEVRCPRCGAYTGVAYADNG